MQETTLIPQEVIEKLKKVEIFSDLVSQSEAMEKVLKIIKKVVVPVGKQITIEGEAGDDAFILVKGSVRIIKKTLQNEEYTVITLNEASHALIGELGLLDSDKRSATVIAETACELFVIHRNEFIEFGNQYPHLALPITRQIAKVLSRRLRKSNQDFISLFSALVNEVSEGVF